MPDMTMKQAAEWAGVSKPTISKALNSGRLSGTKDGNGQWLINPAELERVFPPGNTRNGADTVAVSASDIPKAMGGNPAEMVLLRELLDEVRRERDDLRQDRDKWREQAETQTRLLTHQQQPTPAIVTPSPAPASPPPGRPGLLARIVAVVRPAS